MEDAIVAAIAASAMHKVSAMRELLDMLSLLVQHETHVLRKKPTPAAYHVHGKCDAHEVWDSGASKAPTATTPE